jgi:putative sigma-54 modulation protein
MKVTYTGKHDALTPAQRSRLEAKFAKLARLLDMKQGEREAHVILTQERHIHCAEITVRFHDHNLVGVGVGTEVFQAITDAAGKLEKQILKLHEKWRDIKRGPKPGELEEEALGVLPPDVAAEIETEGGPGKRVFRHNHHQSRKPMTLEEALLEIEPDRDYMVYRDAETDRVSVLVRRRDGNFELIEA